LVKLKWKMWRMFINSQKHLNLMTKNPIDQTTDQKKTRGDSEQRNSGMKTYYNKVLGVKVKCEDCAVIIIQTRIMNHRKEHHNPNIPEGIKNHVARWHSDHLKTIPCPLGCGKYTSTQQLLRYHTQRSCQLSKEADKFKANIEWNKKKKSVYKEKETKKKMYKDLQ